MTDDSGNNQGNVDLIGPDGDVPTAADFGEQHRTAELAESVGAETKRFKGNVRKLKELGLTESLKVGYRLSPRGEGVLQRIKS